MFEGMDDGYVHEVPGGLKQMARQVARAFYTVEDVLIVDMLVRNPCMKEDDICEVLKFDNLRIFQCLRRSELVG